MASWAHAIHRIRMARRREAQPPTTEFGEYKPAYREILKAVRAIGGDPAIDSLTDWIVEQTHEVGTLPEPEAVRERAREICEELGATFPPDSPLAASK